MTSPYRYLEEIATADVAFEAWGATREEAFLAAADATLNTMVEEIGTVAPLERRVFSLAADSLDLLLFELLQELVYHKDADRLLLRVRDLRIEETGSGYRLHADAYGETIDPGKHPSSRTSRRSPCTAFPWKRPSPAGVPSSSSTFEDPPGVPSRPAWLLSREYQISAGNQWRVRLQNEQTESMTGTSTRTPTTVASAAPDPGP